MRASRASSSARGWRWPARSPGERARRRAPSGSSHCCSPRAWSCWRWASRASGRRSTRSSPCWRHSRSLDWIPRPAAPSARSFGVPEPMSLRAFLPHLEHDPAAAKLADEGGSASVSQSLRAFVIAGLADRDVRRPAVVVAGDDRGARDLASDLRAWLHPRPVRYYPSRGVAYESHLTPPPHLVGLRVAALDALTDTPSGSEQPVVVISATALAEKVPDAALRPHGFTLRKGDLLDLEEAANDLVAAGYDRVDQVEERGQFAVRGGLLDIYPATEERAVRVDMFDVEIDSLRWFSTFTQRSLGEADAVEIAPSAELAAEHREVAEIAALEEERPDVADVLPVDRFHAFLDLADQADVLLAAEEEIDPALRDHWQDVCAAFHDTDAHHLYVRPEEVREALAARARIAL